MHLTFPDRPSLNLDHPRIVGILNLTPDSFSDGGTLSSVDAAVAAGLTMARAGASILDVGGESTRPGATRVPADEQIRRVVPAIRALRRALDDAGHHTVPISLDTTRTAVATAALDAGAAMLNDISAGRESDGAILRLAADRRVPIVLMHMLGQPGTMQQDPHYRDVVAEVHTFLARRAAAAIAAGLPASQVILDPGIGFGKTLEHNLALLRSLDRLVGLGHRVLLGTSRKRMFAALDPTAAANPADRLGGTVATTALGVAAGVQLFRVHDIGPNLQAARLAHALRG